MAIGEARPCRDSGAVCDVYFCFTGDEIPRFYHVELETIKDEQKGNTIRLSPVAETIKDEQKGEPIRLSPVAISDPDAIGRSGVWTACGEHIYWSGGYGPESTLLPQLFGHDIHKYELNQWEIQCHHNCRPYPFRNPFAAADVVDQKVYFMGGIYCPVHDDVDSSCYDGPPTDDDRWCGECFDLRTQTWSSLDRTPFKEIRNSRTRYEVAATVKDSADDESMEIVYYDMAAGSILYLDVTNGGSCHRVDDDDFALLRHPPLERLPQGLHDVDLAELILTVENTRAVVAMQTFYWFNFFDWRLYAYDVKAKTWLKSSSLPSSLFPPPCSTPPDGYGFPQYPLLLGLPNKVMVLIIPTSPRELTVASFIVHRKTKNSKPWLRVVVKATQAYCFDDQDPERTLMLLGGQALLRTSPLSIPVNNSALSEVGARIVDGSRSRAKGTVKKFSHSKGFGLITPNDGGEDQVFHLVDVKDFRSLAVGEAVEFEIKCDSNGCTRAVRIIGSHCGGDSYGGFIGSDSEDDSGVDSDGDNDGDNDDYAGNAPEVIEP